MKGDRYKYVGRCLFGVHFGDDETRLTAALFEPEGENYVNDVEIVNGPRGPRLIPSGLHVAIVSEDPDKEHEAIRPLEDKFVRVTIELLE